MDTTNKEKVIQTRMQLNHSHKPMIKLNYNPVTKNFSTVAFSVQQRVAKALNTVLAGSKFYRIRQLANRNNQLDDDAKYTYLTKNHINMIRKLTSSIRYDYLSESDREIITKKFQDRVDKSKELKANKQEQLQQQAAEHWIHDH